MVLIDEIGDDVHVCDYDTSPVWNMQPWFSPHNIEIGTEFNTVLLKKESGYQIDSFKMKQK